MRGTIENDGDSSFFSIVHLGSADYSAHGEDSFIYILAIHIVFFISIENVDGALDVECVVDSLVCSYIGCLYKTINGSRLLFSGSFLSEHFIVYDAGWVDVFRPLKDGLMFLVDIGMWEYGGVDIK